MKLRFIKATARSYYVYRVFARGGGTRLLGAVSRDPRNKFAWANNHAVRVFASRREAAENLTSYK